MTNIEKIQLCQEIVNQIQAESKRPVCRLRLSRESFTITDSHLGGVPYIPHNGKIPTDNDGNQLWLCAQINSREATSQVTACRHLATAARVNNPDAEHRGC